MSISQAPGRAAYAATESRRRAITEILVERLCVFILAGATVYILVGPTPFTRDAVDRSADISPINRWVWLALLVLSLPVIWLRRREVAALLSASWPMLVLFGWFALSTTWALDLDASIRRVTLFYVVLAIFVAVTAGLRRPHLAHLVVTLCAGLVVLIDLGSWPVVPGIAMTDLGFAGMHAQKNITGELALFCALATTTCLLFRQRRVLRAWLWLQLAAAVVVLVASRSATSLSLGIGALIVMPVLITVLRRSPAVMAAAGAAVLLAVASMLFLYLVWAGMAGRDPLEPLSNVTFTLRTDLWKFLLENIRAHPLLGSGFGSFWAINPAVQPSLQTGLWFSLGNDVANQGHDAYLDIAATTGLIGLAMALAVLGRAIFLALLLVRRGGSPFPLAFLLVIAVHNVTESSMFTANSALGVFFVLTAVQLEKGSGVRDQGSGIRDEGSGIRRKLSDLPILTPDP